MLFNSMSPLSPDTRHLREQQVFSTQGHMIFQYVFNSFLCRSQVRGKAGRIPGP